MEDFYPMVKFLITRDDFYPDQIEFLRGNYTVVPGEIDGIFDAGDEFAGDLGVLEKAGIVKIIRERTNLDDGVIQDLDVLNASIERVEKKDGDPVFFYVYISGKEQPIRFTTPEFGALSKWREKLMDIDIVLSTHKKGIWGDFDEFIHSLIHRADVVWKDEESEDEIYASIVLSEIDRLVLVETWEDFLRNPRSFIIDNDGARIVKSSTINDILNQKQINMNLTKLREVMRLHLAGNSKQKHIGGKWVSIWFLKPTISGVVSGDDE